MNSDRYEIRFSGSGGQGIILAAVIMADAAGVYEGKYVCQTQSYGPEARGGSSKAEVVISDRPIDYPKALNPDLLLAMNQASCDAYFADHRPDGLLVIDNTLVTQVPTRRCVAIPFTRMARKETGSEVAANMVALGAVARLSGAVSIKKIETALRARVPGGTEDLNIKAFRAGVRAAKKVSQEALPEKVFPEEEEV
jgi:2-oxoglutarate ferredoxin oxidoreductase subunit gamma